MWDHVSQVSEERGLTTLMGLAITIAKSCMEQRTSKINVETKMSLKFMLAS